MTRFSIRIISVVDMLISDTIRLLLDSIGRSEEYEFYLRKFQSDRSDCFCLLCPDSESLRQAGDVLKLHLRFLVQLGLCPAVIASGPHAEAMKNVLLEGDDADSCELLELDRRALAESPDALRARLHQVAESARRAERYALFIVRAPLPTALAAISPLISRRILFIRMRGALRDLQGRDISLYRILRNQPQLSPDDRPLRELALALLDSVNHIAVTSPFQMLKEIFTVKGSGTILRPGSVISCRTFHADIDEERLRALLLECFGRSPRHPDFFKRIDFFYIEENYKGAILLERRPQGNYLSKFAVDTQARGEGVAQELWEAAAAAHPALFWRSRRSKSINRWYARLADGHHSNNVWNVFWRGISPADIPAVIDFCLTRPDDFADAAAAVSTAPAR